MSDLPPPPLEQPVGQDDPLAHVPVARPIFAEAWMLPAPNDPVTAAVRLSPLRAVWQLVALILVGVAGVLLGIKVIPSFGLTDPRWEGLAGTGITAMACVVAVFAMARSAGQGPGSIGWRVNDAAMDIGLGLISGMALLVCVMAASILAAMLFPELLKQSEHTREAIEQTLPRMSLPAMAGMLVLVAVWEEVVFRGFLLTRLQAMFRRWWLTVPLASALFTLGHLYEGAIAMLVVWGLGVAMGALFVWRRSLLPPMVMHFVFNFVMMMVMRTAYTDWH